MGILTEAEVKTLLRKKVYAASQKEIAKELGISAAYLCDILQGRRDVSASVAAMLGLRRHVVFYGESIQSLPEPPNGVE